MGSFCGSGTQTVVQTASNPNVVAQQNAIYSQINDYASRFGGNPSQLIAPWNALQTTAAQGVADAAQQNQPWIGLGQGMVGQGSSTAGLAPSFYGQAAQSAGGISPIGSTAWNPTPYESPYTQDVINATRANIEQSNAVAQNSALGNAIQQGAAFGGDRAGLAQAELARNQGLAENQTIAALQQADFNQAAQQANAQQQYLLNLGQANNALQLQQAGLYGQLGQGMTQAGLAQGNLGYQLGNLANLGQQSQLGAYQGLYNMGVGLQGTQQQELSAPLTFGAWYGNASPGTAAVPTSTTYPGSSPLSTITGLGLAGLGGASLLSQLSTAPLFAVKGGGRVGEQGVGSEDHDDLVGRYHKIKSTLHRQAGGQAQSPTQMQTGMDPSTDPMALVRNTPVGASQMPTSRAQTVGRELGWLQSAQNAKKPVQEQFATQQLQQLAQQSPIVSARGGAINKQDGGGTSIGEPWSATSAAFDPNNAFKTLADLAHKFHKQQQPQSPTQAPQAPGTVSPGQSLSALGSGLSALGNMGSDTGWQPEAAHGGRIHKQDGGDATIPISGYLTDQSQMDDSRSPIWDAVLAARMRAETAPAQQPSVDVPNPTRVSSYAPAAYEGPATAAPAQPAATPKAAPSPIDYDTTMRENRDYQNQYRKMLPGLAMLKTAGGLLGRYPNGLPMNFGGIGAGVETMQQGYQADLAQRADLLKELRQRELEIPQAQLAKIQVQEAGEELPINRAIRQVLSGAPQAGTTPIPSTNFGVSPSPAASAAPAAAPSSSAAPSAPQTSPEVEAKAAAALQSSANVHALTPRVARIEQTPEGPIAVDPSNKPLFNISREIELANAMSASKRYGPTGVAKLKLLDTLLNQGIQPTVGGGVTDIPGYASTKANIKGAEEEATAPYQILKSVGSQSGRPVVAKPGETITTGAQANPDVSGALQWAKSRIPGMAPAAAAPGAPAAGMTGTPGQGAELRPPIATGLRRNPDGSVSTVQTEEDLALQKHSADEFAKSTEAYKNSVAMKQRLTSMEHSLDDLNATKGYWNTGTGADAKLSFAKAANSLAQTVGAEPIVDPHKISSWEKLSKDTTNLGFQLARTLGSREAMMIVQQAINSVPGAANTPMGAKMVLNSIRWGNQHDIDQYEFTQQYYQQNHTTFGADVAFNQRFPPRLYAERAIEQGQRNIPEGAVDLLRSNPQAARDFNAKYGQDGTDVATLFLQAR